MREKIADLLVARDPLSENVKLGKKEMLFGALTAVGGAIAEVFRGGTGHERDANRHGA